MQLASFLEDPQYQDQHSLHMEIIRTFGRVGPNAEPRFRDECMERRPLCQSSNQLLTSPLISSMSPLVVLPHLHKLALANNSQAVENKRVDIATQLFEAYSALSCCCILP